MTHALLARHLRHHVRLLLSILAGFAALEWLIVWIASEIEAGPGFQTLITQLLPPAFRGIVESQMGAISLGGMVGFGFQHPAILAGAFAFVIVAATIPAGERETGFLDLVLARPVPRPRYLLAVLILLVLGAAVLPLGLLLGLGLGLATVTPPEPIELATYLPAAFGLSTLLLSIGGYSLLFGATARRRGSAVARAVGLTIVFYLTAFLANAWPPLSSLRWFTPFHYFNPVRMVALKQAPLEHPFVLLGVFLVSTAAAFWAFHRQDL